MNQTSPQDDAADRHGTAAVPAQYPPFPTTPAIRTVDGTRRVAVTPRHHAQLTDPRLPETDLRTLYREAREERVGENDGLNVFDVIGVRVRQALATEVSAALHGLAARDGGDHPMPGPGELEAGLRRVTEGLVAAMPDLMASAATAPQASDPPKVIVLKLRMLARRVAGVAR